MAQTSSTLAFSVVQAFQSPRGRLTASMVILGCALGASALIVSMLAQSASMNYPEPPVRLGLIPSLIFSAGGGLAGALLAGLFGLLMVDSKRPRVSKLSDYVRLSAKGKCHPL